MRRKIDAFDVFNFTQRLNCCVFPSLLVIDRHDRTGETLREISDGKTCLFDTPQEITKKAFKGRRKEMEEFLRRNIGTLIRRDREIARKILADLKKRL
jgi:hypothetical protein